MSSVLWNDTSGQLGNLIIEMLLLIYNGIEFRIKKNKYGDSLYEYFPNLLQYKFNPDVDQDIYTNANSNINEITYEEIKNISPYSMIGSSWFYNNFWRKISSYDEIFDMINSDNGSLFMKYFHNEQVSARFKHLNDCIGVHFRFSDGSFKEGYDLSKDLYSLQNTINTLVSNGKKRIMIFSNRQDDVDECINDNWKRFDISVSKNSLFEDIIGMSECKHIVRCNSWSTFSLISFWMKTFKTRYMA